MTKQTNCPDKFLQELDNIPEKYMADFIEMNETIKRAWNKKEQSRPVCKDIAGNYYVFGKNYKGEWTLFNIEKREECYDQFKWWVWEDAHSYHKDCIDQHQTLWEACEGFNS